MTRPRPDGPAPRETATVQFRGRTLRFAIDNPVDAVQKVLVRGQFYEARLLRQHADHIFKGSTVLDIGANVGNHTVFYAFSAAARVYSFEPNPRARACCGRHSTSTMRSH